MSTARDELLAEIVQEVKDEFVRTEEQNDNPTREDFYADAGRRLNFIANHGVEQ